MTQRPSDWPTLALHLVPGHFGDQSERLLERMAKGDPQLRVQLAGEEPGPLTRAFLEQVLALDAGQRRRWPLRATLTGARGASAALEAFADGTTGRILLGLEVPVPGEDQRATHKDLEITLLGYACAALAGSSQGAALIGPGLGGLGVGRLEGRVSERVASAASIAAEGLEVLVLAPDTHDSMGALPGFEEATLGDLFTWRRSGQEAF